jgi:DNA-directed RNA polymerase subunit RPC12/RpoP
MQQVECATAVRCPSCGSTDVTAIPLSLIQAKYYKCVTCIVTFRALSREEEPADIERFNRGWALPPDDESGF